MRRIIPQRPDDPGPLEAIRPNAAYDVDRCSCSSCGRSQCIARRPESVSGLSTGWSVRSREAPRWPSHSYRSTHGTGDVHRRHLCAPRHRVHGPSVPTAPGVDGRPPRAGSAPVGRRVPGNPVAESRACGRKARRAAALEPARARRGTAARRPTAGGVPPRHVDRISPSLAQAWTFEMSLRIFLALLCGYVFLRELGCPDHSFPGGSRGVGSFELHRVLPGLSAFSGGGALPAAATRAASTRARPRTWTRRHHRRGSASHRDFGPSRIDAPYGRRGRPLLPVRAVRRARRQPRARRRRPSAPEP